MVAVLLLAGPALGAARAQGLSESTGVNQYFTNCARCHESTDSARGAAHVGAQADDARAHLRSPDDWLDEDDRRESQRTRTSALIAEWVGGRKIDTDAAGAAEKMPNQCATIRPCAISTRPDGMAGASIYQNSRSQSRDGRWAVAGSGVAAAAEMGIWISRRHGALRAGRDRRPAVRDVERRLRLLARRRNRMRPLVVSDRSRVVRSGFTVGRLSRASPRLAVFFGDIHGMAYALDASTGELALEDADRSASARAHHRHAGAL